MFLHLANIAYHTGGNWFPPLSETFTRHEREPLLAARSGFIPQNTFSSPPFGTRRVGDMLLCKPTGDLRDQASQITRANVTVIPAGVTPAPA